MVGSSSATASGPVSSLRSAHYHVLLLSLAALLLVAPIAQQFPRGRDVVNALFLATLVFGALVGRRSRLVRRLRVGVAAFTALLMAMTYVVDHGAVAVARDVLLFGFLIFILVGILRDVFEARQVEAGLLSGAVSGYVLLGVAWAIAYALVEAFDPDAFAGAGAPPVGEGAASSSRAGTFLYHSFVTLTTLGYGDVTPRSGAARSLSILEALVGQFYIATLIAALVGTMIAQRTSGRGDRED
ncbi:MAG: potassium channel family protein [Planctomycetota bacterium JB042]